ncbi:MAG: NAD-dependent epimerase/dehydratase family protein [Lentisphaerae bacterium]|nr:NAD-dependent epimerase/dehydratase family protein [Lentisphaerota bacterium]
MRILITGICGFAGSTLAESLRAAQPGLEVMGLDNFIRPGSELNRHRLQEAGIRVLHADLRLAEDLESLPAVDWVIDAAANPSVLAGTRGSGTTSRQLLQHNLAGTVNVIEYCRTHHAGFLLLSTSRVYSIPPLAALQVEVHAEAFRPCAQQAWPTGISPAGVNESFPTTPPVSLYGASKVCSEALALEYGQAFDFPVWINRLGVLAGAGQFGRADQGIFSYWIHMCARQRPLAFIGFGGAGHQVRDCLHPRDLVPLLLQQMARTPTPSTAVTNVAGGTGNAFSLLQLHRWCETRFGAQPVERRPETRPFDVPWMILDSACAAQRFGWCVQTPLASILEEIARHAEANPHWLDWTASG